MKKIKIFAFALLLMLWPINISASEYDGNEKVILGGEPFGIKMFCEGVMVIELEHFESSNGKCCPAEKAGLKVNDVIISANGQYLNSNNTLNDIISKSHGNIISLKIKRNNNKLDLSVTPIKDINGVYKIGIWVKDSTAGIGTITFYSQELGSFCGLGHGICDTDTGGLIPIKSGDVDKAYVSSVSKSENGNIGSLEGYFTKFDIGSATINADNGIYGLTEENNITGKEIIVAEKEEVKLGKATILTTINGCTPQEYEALIIKIDRNNETLNMIIEITDEDLLSKTGGIVQGMSGSPIIQNGKLIGAVTHVLIDEPEKGYAIFAENMLITSQKLYEK